MVWAFDLIDSKREWMGICGNPRCQRRFVSTRKGRAAFCSPKCSAYVRIARARGKMAPVDEGKGPDAGNTVQAAG